MQIREDSRRLGTNTERRRLLTGLKWAQPIWRPSQPPFDLDAIRTIYSPEARSHASTHLSSAAEEQRREGHHVGEERVELLD
jgi:hypothetical protein